MQKKKKQFQNGNQISEWTSDDKNLLKVRHNHYHPISYPLPKKHQTVIGSLAQGEKRKEMEMKKEKKYLLFFF